MSDGIATTSIWVRVKCGPLAELQKYGRFLMKTIANIASEFGKQHEDATNANGYTSAESYILAAINEALAQQKAEVAETIREALKQAEEQQDRAEAAEGRLAKVMPYVQHKDGCKYQPSGFGCWSGRPIKRVKCTCGLAALLAEGEK